MIQHKRCGRCARMMPLSDVIDSLTCPQCHWKAPASDWTSNVFALPRERRVGGSWLAMLHFCRWRKRQGQPYKTAEEQHVRRIAG
ncbi:hypothetical protein Pan14r_51970 [Crateriforma conspicua]|uniref:Uncharacterized protein n=1 Tax=Crateriforma conspicua TaxID=2527996 RepID=A0A5C5XSS2_9PLAN|nr:hypothetical protein Pan14r_51970 [Crateriforma conspicua]